MTEKSYFLQCKNTDFFNCFIQVERGKISPDTTGGNLHCVKILTQCTVPKNWGGARGMVSSRWGNCFGRSVANGIAEVQCPLVAIICFALQFRIGTVSALINCLPPIGVSPWALLPTDASPCVSLGECFGHEASTEYLSLLRQRAGFPWPQRGLLSTSLWGCRPAFSVSWSSTHSVGWEAMLFSLPSLEKEVRLTMVAESFCNMSSTVGSVFQMIYFLSFIVEHTNS